MFGEDIEMLCDVVVMFVVKEIMLCVVEVDCIDQFLMDLWKKFGDFGVFGMIVFEEYGGVNMGYIVYMVVMEEILCVLVLIGLLYGVYLNLCVNQIYCNGIEVQKQKYLLKFVLGEYIGVFVMSELNVGFDVVSMKLWVDKCGDCYVLNGMKMWIINGFDCDMLVVYVKIDIEVGLCGIIVFIVEKGMKGFLVVQKFDKFGMCGLYMGELVFQDVEVLEENIFGQFNGGVKVLMSGFDYECVVLLGGLMGIMVVCFDVVVLYIYDCKQFGQVIGEFQLIQGKVVDMYIMFQVCCVYLYVVGCYFDLVGSDYICQVCKDCVGVIFYMVEKVMWMVGEVIQIFGGNGYINEYLVGCLWCDVKLYEIGVGMSEICWMLIGCELFVEMM